MRPDIETRPASTVAGQDEVSPPLPAPPAAGPGPDEERPLLISAETLLRLI